MADEEVSYEWLGDEPKPKQALKKPVKTPEALVPQEKNIIETEKRGGVYEPVKGEIAPKEDEIKIWGSTRLERKQENKPSFWSRFKRKGYKAKTKAYRGTKWGHGFAKRNVERSISAGQTFPVIRNPLQIFSLAWNRLSATIKWLIVLVMFLAILFVPWGIFYYTGWAVAAAVMFLISLIYWIFINIFNGIAYVLISFINAIVSVIMGVVIRIVETLMGILVAEGPDFLDHSYFNTARCGESGTTSYQGQCGVWEYYWRNGHELLDNSMISYDMIAEVPALMVVSAPAWQDWMFTPLIVKAFEHIPGLAVLVDAYQEHIGWGISNAFKTFVETAEPWQVVLVGMAPVIAIVTILVAIYFKFRKDVRR